MIKIRLGHLDHYQMVAERNLESEAGELAAIFAAISRNMKARLQRERDERLKLKLKLK